MPDPSDLPANVQAILGTPCSEEPCDQCRPHPNVTCQVSKDSKTWVWIPAQIHNADAGHLIMVPSDGAGPIGALLFALEPAQSYAHEAIMIEENLPCATAPQAPRTCKVTRTEAMAQAPSARASQPMGLRRMRCASAGQER